MIRNQRWRELLAASLAAVEELTELHNTHVYSPDDKHPADCKLCRTTKRLLAAAKECDASPRLSRKGSNRA